jgi:hypothetical protein
MRLGMNVWHCSHPDSANPAGKRPLGRPGHRWEDTIMNFSRNRWEVWTGFIWLRIGTSGRLC